jgi:hypothetical protein
MPPRRCEAGQGREAAQPARSWRRSRPRHGRVIPLCAPLLREPNRRASAGVSSERDARGCASSRRPPCGKCDRALDERSPCPQAGQARALRAAHAAGRRAPVGRGGSAAAGGQRARRADRGRGLLPGARAGDPPRPAQRADRGLVHHAGVRARPRGAAGAAARVTGRGGRVGRRSRAAVGRGSGARVRAAPGLRAQGARRARARDAHQGRAGLERAPDALPPREARRDRRRGRLCRRHRPDGPRR